MSYEEDRLRQERDLRAAQMRVAELENELANQLMSVESTVDQRAFDEQHIHKLHRTLALLSNINQSIVRIRYTPKLFQTACEIAVEKGGFRAAWLALLAQDGRSLKPVAYAGIPEESFDPRVMPLNDKEPTYQTPANIAIREGTCVIVNDIEHDERLTIGREELLMFGCRASVTFPLKVGDTVRGVFALYSTESGFFDEEELHLLNEMAGDIAFAMEVEEQEVQRQQAELTLKRYAERLEVLHSIDLALIEGGSIENLIDTTIKQVRKLIPCTRLGVVLHDHETNEALVFARDDSGSSEIAKGVRLPLPPARWFEEFDSNGIKIIDDVLLLPDPPSTYRIPIKEGMRSFLHILLISKGLHIGTLNLASTTPNFFTPEYQEVAGEIANQLAIAVHQMHLTQELERYTADLEFRVLERTAELQAAKEQVEAILNNSLDGILFLDVDFAVVQTNTAFESLLGYPPDSPLAFTDIVHVEDRSRLEQAVETAMRDNRGTYFEARVYHHDGSHFEAEIGLTNIFDDGFVCSIHNISKRKSYERQLLYYASLQEHVTDAVIATDLEFNIRSWNKAAERMYGWRADEVIGKPVDAIFKTQFRLPEIARCSAGELLEKGYWTDEVLQQRKDGSMLHVLSSVVLFKDGEGATFGVVAVNHDITERKKVEQALHQALETERETNLLKLRFVSMASHEFRTPLAGILTSADTLYLYRHKMTDDDIKRKLENIQRLVQHMTGIMEDVLELGRMQSGYVDFNPGLTDLDVLCRGVLAEFNDRPDEQNRITYVFPGSPVIARIDSRLMQQCVMNMISNALKYSPPEKPIHIKLSSSDQFIRLDIADEGIGIPPGELAKIFEPFHRASNVAAISGTGLGLSIAKRAIEQHGGTITVASRVNEGTTFTIVIPIRATSN